MYVELVQKILSFKDERRESLLINGLEVNITAANALIIKDLGNGGSKDAFIALNRYRDLGDPSDELAEILEVAISQLESKYASSARGAITLVQEPERKGQVSLSENVQGRVSQIKKKQPS
tara:strand:- start:89 stop:448 length:360 start_codon:yes stop_codon:yes gene_type:complete